MGSEITLIHEALESLFFAFVPLSQEVIMMMGKYDAFLQKAALTPTWPEVSEDLVRSPSHRKLLHLFKIFAKRRDSFPGQLRGILEESFSAAVHFMFDVASLLGFGDMDPTGATSYSSLVDLASMYPALHRSAYPSESRPWKRVEHGVPMATLIDKLMRNPAQSIAAIIGNEKTRNQFKQIFSLVAQLVRLDVSDYATTDHLLSHQITNDICPHTKRFAEPIAREAIWRQHVLNLIEFCRMRVPMFSVVWMSINIDMKAPAGRTSFTSRDIEAGVVALLSPKTLWSAGLDQAIWHSTDLSLDLLLRLVQTHPVLEYKHFKAFFRPRSRFTDEGDFERYTIALGRALALAMRYQNNIFDVLDLDKRAMEGIFDEVPVSTLCEIVPYYGRLVSGMSSEETLKTLKEHFYEPIFYIQLGFQDVLGPLGVKSFSSAEWVAYYTTGVPINFNPVL